MFDKEAMGHWKEINWRILSHNHHDWVNTISNKCPLCLIEDALYGGLV